MIEAFSGIETRVVIDTRLGHDLGEYFGNNTARLAVFLIIERRQIGVSGVVSHRFGNAGQRTETKTEAS